MKEKMWIFDKEAQAMVLKDITYVPGLYKIFDEILVNAADNKIRDRSNAVFLLTQIKYRHVFLSIIKPTITIYINMENILQIRITKLLIKVI